MTARTRALLDAYQKKRTPLAEAATPEIDPVRRAYRQAAAVLHRFSPEALLPFGEVPRSENPRLLLFDDLEPAPGDWLDFQFALRPEVRRAALRELETRKRMLAALQANPDRPLTGLQVTWEGYLQSGRFQRLETLGYRELTYVGQILAWVEGIHTGLPSQDEVLELIRRKSVLASFEHLVADDFTGREDELELLRGYVGALPAREERKDILGISGVGGIGKTALIAKLLLEYAQADGEGRVPFAYLAFDQPTLRIDAPFTLLIEAASQLEAQYPEWRRTIEDFRREVRDSHDVRVGIADRVRSDLTRGQRIGHVIGEDRHVYRAFGRMLNEISLRTIDGADRRSPVLLVFDTFEEVQYRDHERLVGFWRMLEEVTVAFKQLRVIVSGRGPISVTPKIANLTELQPPDAETLLERLGVTDADVAKVIARQVGGSPLVLRLAASVVTTDPTMLSDEGIPGLSFKVDKEIIQGQLYRRVLAHIHDEDVRTLAHPGMVLRRVTPDVILHVLAPVLLRQIGPEESEHLFAILKREHALVTLEQGALVFRPDIRRSMIRLLEQDRYGSVRELRRAAIEYYETQSGTEARAEEMYHRLALGEDELRVLDDRWGPDLEQSVVPNLDEYPDRMKAWLASRASVEVPRSVFAAADAADWERNITRKVQRALSELQVEWALYLLGERTERSEASPLFALEAKAHMLAEDQESARRCVDAGIEKVETSNNRGRLAELFWLRSQLEIGRGDLLGADRSLAMAEKAIEGAKSPVPLTHVLCHRLLLRFLHPGSYGERTPAVRLRLARACGRIDESIAYSVEFIVRMAMELLENEHPLTRDRLSRFVDPDANALEGELLTSENLRGLDEYRAPWELEAEPVLESLS